MTRQDNFMALVLLCVAAHYGDSSIVASDINRLTKLFSSEDIEIANSSQKLLINL